MTDSQLIAAWITDIERAIPTLTAPIEQSVRTRLETQLALLRRVQELEREVARLRGYAQHTPECSINQYRRTPTDEVVCTCGLG
jgi:hypothetical protein